MIDQKLKISNIYERLNMNGSREYAIINYELGLGFNKVKMYS